MKHLQIPQWLVFRIVELASVCLLFQGCSFSASPSGLSNIIAPSVKWTTSGFSPEDVRTLAIWSPAEPEKPQTASLNRATASGIEQVFTESCLQKGYDLVTRARLDEVIGEIERQGGGMSDPNSAARAGKMLNATHVLVIKASAFVSRQRVRNEATGRAETVYTGPLRMDIQLIEVESARPAAAASVSSKFESDDPNDVTTSLVGLGKRAAKTFPAKVSQAKPQK